MPWHRSRLSQPGILATVVAATLATGCSLSSPPLTPSASSKPSPTSSSSHPATKAPTALNLISVWGGVGPIGPPLTVACRDGGRSVSISGAFGPETTVVLLRGLHPGRTYKFVEYGPPVAATVTVTESGPVRQLVNGGSSVTDFLGPESGVETQGYGTLTVARGGERGSLDVNLPDDGLSGHWSCSHQGTVGASTPNRPVLSTATAAPVLNECWLLPAAGTPPVTCPNGDFNLAGWVPSNEAALGRDATLEQVYRALCRDVSQAATYGGPNEDAASLQTSYVEAATYYGWNFHMTPAAVVAGSGCSG